MVPSSSEAKAHYSMSSDQRLAKKQNTSASRNAVKHKYEVVKGDSFWKISRRFGVSSSQLAKWNNMSPKDPLSVGKTLVIWTKPSSTAPPSEDAVIRKVAYKVRSGDSLAKIAGKFRVKIQDIARWNKINIEKYLQPGQALVLFVNVKNG
jgi:membrane-bound lytic murein transglycosylase D